MQCEDPRDKVYGLLGLVDGQERPDVDYSKPLYQVYSDTVNLVHQHQPHWTTCSVLDIAETYSWKEFARDVGFSEKTIDVLAQLFRDLNKQFQSAKQKNCSYTPIIELQPAMPSAGTPD
jgi:hypothetical protein